MIKKIIVEKIGIIFKIILGKIVMKKKMFKMKMKKMKIIFKIKIHQFCCFFKKLVIQNMKIKILIVIKEIQNNSKFKNLNLKILIKTKLNRI